MRHSRLLSRALIVLLTSVTGCADSGTNSLDQDPFPDPNPLWEYPADYSRERGTLYGGKDWVLEPRYHEANRIENESGDGLLLRLYYRHPWLEHPPILFPFACDILPLESGEYTVHLPTPQAGDVCTSSLEWPTSGEGMGDPYRAIEGIVHIAEVLETPAGNQVIMGHVDVIYHPFEVDGVAAPGPEGQFRLTGGFHAFRPMREGQANSSIATALVGKAARTR